MGPSGSGKTTISNKLAKKYHTKSYELDCVIYDDLDNHRKRTDKEIKTIFEEIINKNNWIIEDVGRDKFNKGLEYADKIYYIKIPKLLVYKRIITRWIKQRLGREKYNYPPTLFQFYDMLKTAKEYYKNEYKKIEKLNKYKDKVEYLTYKKIKDI